jgi:hypothetical protein
MKPHMKTNTPALLNALINLTWTGLFFSPILVFWISNFNPWPLAFILLIGFIPVFVPYRWYGQLQICHNRVFYESLFIHHFQKLTQDGAWVKGLQKKYSGAPSFREIRETRRKLLDKIRAYETFHYACLPVFLGTAIYALMLGSPLLALLITAANLLYNVVPILIQQYNKSRIGSITSKKPPLQQNSTEEPLHNSCLYLRKIRQYYSG